jgi:hypothetical protein
LTDSLREVLDVEGSRMTAGLMRAVYGGHAYLSTGYKHLPDNPRSATGQRSLSIGPSYTYPVGYPCVHRAYGALIGKYHGDRLRLKNLRLVLIKEVVRSPSQTQSRNRADVPFNLSRPLCAGKYAYLLPLQRLTHVLRQMMMNRLNPQSVYTLLAHT